MSDPIRKGKERIARNKLTNDKLIPQLRTLLRPQLQRSQEFRQNCRDKNDGKGQQQIRLNLTFRRQSEIGFSHVKEILNALKIDGEDFWVHVESRDRFGDVLAGLLLPEIGERSVEEGVGGESR